jgi:hypothetical protein
MRTAVLAVFVLDHAAVLFAAGAATLWWSQDLMLWLVFMVGEERAFGPASVVHLEGGGKLLTNPSAMVRWTLPFWFLGAMQISAAIALVGLWARRPNHGAAADPGHGPRFS